MWDGYKAYKLFLIVSQVHFKRKDYSIKTVMRNKSELDFILKGVSRENYEKKSFSNYFKNFSRDFSYIDAFTFFVANCVYGNSGISMVLDRETGEKNYNKWKGNKESINRILERDLRLIFNCFKSIPDDTEKYVKLFGMYQSGKVNVETIIIIEKCFRLFDRIEKELKILEKRIEDEILGNSIEKEEENSLDFFFCAENAKNELGDSEKLKSDKISDKIRTIMKERYFVKLMNEKSFESERFKIQRGGYFLSLSPNVEQIIKQIFKLN